MINPAAPPPEPPYNKAWEEFDRTLSSENRQFFLAMQQEKPKPESGEPGEGRRDKQTQV